MEAAVAMLHDVVYLMSRADDVHQESVLFKFAARARPVFTKAFPTTPYLLVYCEPVQVIMSHLQNEKGQLSAQSGIATTAAMTMD
jgi:hypothetical protein